MIPLETTPTLETSPYLMTGGGYLIFDGVVLAVAGTSTDQVRLTMPGSPNATRPGVDATYLRNFPRHRNSVGRRGTI